jgi:hypothetical protein
VRDKLLAILGTKRCTRPLVEQRLAGKLFVEGKEGDGTAVANVVLREVRTLRPTGDMAESDIVGKDLSGKLRRIRGVSWTKRRRGRSKTVNENQCLVRDLEYHEDVVIFVKKDKEDELLERGRYILEAGDGKRVIVLQWKFFARKVGVSRVAKIVVHHPSQ